MAPLVADAPSILVNPLATPDQLATSASQLDGVPRDLEDSIRFQSARLTQAAGILLKLPQDVIAQAIVTLARFWTGPEGGSLRLNGARDVSMACLYLTAKQSAHPKSTRSVVNVFAFLAKTLQEFEDLPPSGEVDPESYHVTEGAYLERKQAMLHIETQVLRVLGFQTHVALPYTLCINYLQTLDVSIASQGSDLERRLVKRAMAHLNAALLSPQLLYLTHQPPALATAAIYLAAKQVGVKLPEGEWWEVFDTDREELGFLVVALRSIEGFAEEEKEKWRGRRVPMTTDEVDGVIALRQQSLNGGG